MKKNSRCVVFIVPVFIVADISERIPLLYECAAALARMKAGRWRVIFVDYKSCDVDWDRVLSLSDNFSRLDVSAGVRNQCVILNKGIAQASSDDIIVVHDADLLAPPNFVEHVRQRVSPGKMYFPVRYSLHEDKAPKIYGDDARDADSANGWWRHTSTGTACGIKSDFERIGLYDARIGTSWGERDTHLFARAVLKLIVVREKCPGLFHLWHPYTLEYKNRGVKTEIELAICLTRAR